MKRSGRISFHVKTPCLLADDGTPLPIPDLDALRDTLRAANPQLAALEFYRSKDEEGNEWHRADVDGFFLKRNVEEIANDVARTARPEGWVLIWISDEDDNEAGWEVFRDTVKRDQYLRD